MIDSLMVRGRIQDKRIRRYSYVGFAYALMRKRIRGSKHCAKCGGNYTASVGSDVDMTLKFIPLSRFTYVRLLLSIHINELARATFLGGFLPL